MIHRRRRAIAAAMAAVLAAPLGALAQGTWPDKPIKLIVPYSAGGVTDVLGRLVAKHLQDVLKVPVVVDNVTGAGGTIGSAQVAKAPADGSTLLLGATGPISVGKALFPTLAYDPDKDFKPIALLGVTPFVAVTNKSTGFKTLKDVVDAAKHAPGKLSYGSAGNGTPQHIIGEMFKQASGTSITHIPYRGSVPAIQDLIGGQIEFMIDNPVNLLAHIKAGTLVPLAQTGSRRLDALKDVPTMAEAGLPRFEATPWYGILAPRDIPPAIAQRLNEEINAYTQRPEVAAKLAELGMEVRPLSLADFAAFLQREGAKWSAATTKVTAGKSP